MTFPKDIPRPAFWFDWDDARVARLIELVESGMPASRIAEELGAPSRSAVLGKLDRLRRGAYADRLKRKQRVQQPTPARFHKPQTPRKTSPMAKPALAKPALAKLEPPSAAKPRGPVTIVDLSESCCRWIVNDDVSRALYCGAPRLDGCSYCLDHWQRAYVRSPSPRRVYYSR